MKMLIKPAVLLAAVMMATSCSSVREESVDIQSDFTDGRQEIVSELPAVTEESPITLPERPLSKTAAPPDTVADFSYYLEERLPEDVKDIVLNNRRHLFVNINPDITENPEKYLALDYEEAIDDMLVKTLQENEELWPGGSLSYETAAQELDFLMTYLKYAYGAYQYYGGDDVFLPLKDTILTELQFGDNGEVYFRDYSDSLYKHLSNVITDCHFGIGGKYFSNFQRHKYFMQNSGNVFYKVDNGFYCMLEDKEYELIAVENQPPKDMLIPYLSGDGHVVWIIGYPSNTEEEVHWTVRLYHEASGETVAKELGLTPVTSTAEFKDLMYNEYDLKGVRVVESRRCESRVGEPDMYAVMRESAENLQSQDIIVVDLRNNKGGNSSYPHQWLSSLLQKEIGDMRGVFTSHRTKTTYETHGSRWANAYDDFMESGLFERWTGPLMDTIRPIDNKDRLFIVLANHYTGSAGEDFVDYVRQAENTIVIGTNTFGSYFTGNVVEVQLPYSNLTLSCGYNLHLEPDLTNIEGIGIQPDIWCPPDESLERVMQFIENYGLADYSQTNYSAIN